MRLRLSGRWWTGRGLFGLRREAKRHAALAAQDVGKAVSPLRSATAVQDAPVGRRLLLVGFVFFSVVAVCLGKDAATAAHPNIILFLTDDMGYGDVGCNGGKFAPTP